MQAPDARQAPATGKGGQKGRSGAPASKHVSRYDFDRLYSNFGGCVPRDARAAVQRSAERYAAWVSGEYDHLT